MQNCQEKATEPTRSSLIEIFSSCKIEEVHLACAVKVFQRIQIGQPLSGEEAEAIFAMKSLLQEEKKVVVISGAVISVKAGSNDVSVPASLTVVSKFLVFKPCKIRRGILSIYLFTTHRWFIRWFARYRNVLNGQSPLLSILS